MRREGNGEWVETTVVKRGITTVASAGVRRNSGPDLLPQALRLAIAE